MPGKVILVFGLTLILSFLAIAARFIPKGMAAILAKMAKNLAYNVYFRIKMPVRSAN